MRKKQRKGFKHLPVPNRRPKVGEFPAPLPLPMEHWRSRWLVTQKWEALHRISEVEWEDEDKIAGKGRAVCGLEALFHMPGIFSRMDLERCPACCEGSRVPPGNGNPYNEGIREPAAA